jgi:hypothetical protein
MTLNQREQVVLNVDDRLEITKEEKPDVP